MDITNLTVKHCRTGFFERAKNDGIKHIKTAPSLSVVQATEGFYSFSLHGQPQKIMKTGESFIAPAHTLQTITHHTDPQSGTMSARWVYMDIVVNDHIPFDHAFSFPAFPSAALCQEINIVLDRIFASDNIVRRKIGCYELLELLLPYATEIHDWNLLVEAAMVYIDQHYRENLTVEIIASAVKTSPPNLYRLFKRITDNTPMAYCNSIRLSHACELLCKNQYTIEEIGTLCGVPDPSYFSKMFKKKFSVTPNAYRKMQAETKYS